MLPAKRMSSDQKKRVILDDDDEDQYQGVIEQPAKKIQKVSDNPEIGAGKVIQRAEAEAEGSDSDEEGGGKNKIKWRTLEHHGVIFFPPYKPHGVKLLHKGKPIDLSQEQEEVCNWWA